MIAREYDVIVVGAGLAGLTAASQLILADKRVLILEATSQIGGRVVVDRMSNIPVEISGQVVQTQHTKMLELLAEVSVNNEQELIKTSSVFSLAKLMEDINTKPYWRRRGLLKALQKLSEILATLDTSRPWSHDSASIIDHMTFADYLRKITATASGFNFLKLYFNREMGYDVSVISALDALHHLNCKGWPDQFSSGSRVMVPVGALHKLFAKFSRALEIKYQHPVHEIEQVKNGIKVSGAFFEFDCRHIVLATPIPSLRSLHIKPHFPSSRKELWKKVFSTEAFRIVSLIEGQPEIRTIESQAPFRELTLIHKQNGQSLFCGEVWGEEAFKLSQLKVNEREALWQGILFRNLGDSIVPLSTTVKFWNDDFWHSGVRLFRPLGSWTIHRDLLAQSNGRIHFAGSETSVPYFGTMEGAVRSGHRAANKILSRSKSFHEV